MGCVFIKQKENVKEKEVEKYSWDVRRSLDVDPQKYVIENIEEREILRLPGSVHGQQFIIQNCKKSTIYILDYINTVTIDECYSCTFILGATTSSVFLRNCIGCICVAACGQFRTRDCRKCNIYLHCETQPIIETSTKIKFGPFRLSYNLLPQHLEASGLNLNLQTWNNVHDFTPVESENNWSFMLENGNSDHFHLRTYSDIVHKQLIDFDVQWALKAPTLLALESSV